MGRRALRKINPSLDLSRHLRDLDSVCRPLKPDALFAKPAPLEVEVGSGKGLFLSRAAAANPATNYLGLEVARKYAAFTAAKLARQQADNALVLCGDAMRFFGEWLDRESLAAVHVYFPDPWWKKRHKKRRIMNAAFLRHVERTLEPGGRLHFWTDVEEYYHAGLREIAASTALAGPEPVAVIPNEHDFDYRTHFERRTRLAGQAVYRAQFRKSET